MRCFTRGPCEHERVSTTPEDSEHDYRNCTDENCVDEGCLSYRAGREAGRRRGYDDGFMKGAADGFERGRRRALGLDEDSPGDS
jgi:hypothetical protein